MREIRQVTNKLLRHLNLKWLIHNQADCHEKNYKGGHKQALLDEKVTEKVTINSLSLQTLKNRSQSSTIGLKI